MTGTGYIVLWRGFPVRFGDTPHRHRVRPQSRVKVYSLVEELDATRFDTGDMAAATARAYGLESYDVETRTW